MEQANKQGKKKKAAKVKYTFCRWRCPDADTVYRDVSSLVGTLDVDAPCKHGQTAHRVLQISSDLHNPLTMKR
jgi:hypothetical protein